MDNQMNQITIKTILKFNIESQIIQGYSLKLSIKKSDLLSV